MKLTTFLSNAMVKKVLCILLLLSIALLSVFVFAKIATSPEAYKNTIASIEDKKGKVMELTTVATLTSTALAIAPGDATNPIAEQIMEISSYLIIVICTLVLEKALLTTFGLLSFQYIIPIACGLLGISLFINPQKLRSIATKLILFALVLVITVPLSMRVSDLIYEMNNEIVDWAATSLSANTEESSAEDKNWLENMVNTIKDSTTEIVEKAKHALSALIDAVALFIIAYCAMPILNIMLIFWLIKVFFGIKISLPKIETFLLFKRKNKSNDLLSEE